MFRDSWVKAPAEKSLGHVQEWEGAQKRDTWGSWRTQPVPPEDFADRKEDEKEDKQKRGKLHPSCCSPADCRLK